MKRLLIIRFSALGDVAMVVPVVQQLATSYPNWDITMLSSKSCAPLFNNLPENVHFFGAELKGKHSGLAGLNRLLHDLQYWTYDAVADMHDVLRSAYLRHRCLMRGKRVAHIHKDRFQKWLLVRHSYHYKHPLQSTISRYRTVLEELGFEITLPTPQSISNSNQDGNKRGIGIAPFAAHKGKIYPIVQMEKVVTELGKKMAERGEKVYLFGAGLKEKDILMEWQEQHIGVECMVGKYNMDEEIRFMGTLRLMLTMDSANMHLASLVGTRVLSIWGATHPWAGFLGYGQSENDCIQRSIPCRPCSIYGNRRCQFGNYMCLDIPVKTIVDQVMNAYQASVEQDTTC